MFEKFFNSAPRVESVKDENSTQENPITTALKDPTIKIRNVFNNKGTAYNSLDHFTQNGTNPSEPVYTGKDERGQDQWVIYRDPTEGEETDSSLATVIFEGSEGKIPERKK